MRSRTAFYCGIVDGLWLTELPGRQACRGSSWQAWRRLWAPGCESRSRLGAVSSPLTCGSRTIGADRQVGPGSGCAVFAASRRLCKFWHRRRRSRSPCLYCDGSVSSVFLTASTALMVAIDAIMLRIGRGRSRRSGSRSGGCRRDVVGGSGQRSASRAAATVSVRKCRSIEFSPQVKWIWLTSSH